MAAGDLIGGSPIVSGLFQDEPSVEALNALGLDVSSVGNHEFDEGVPELLRMQYGGCHPTEGCFDADGYSGADFPWLAANVTYKTGVKAPRPKRARHYGDWFGSRTGRTVLPPTWVKQVDGVKVGFIGMTLEGTPELVAQAGIKDVDFRDEVETANLAARGPAPARCRGDRRPPARGRASRRRASAYDFPCTGAAPVPRHLRARSSRSRRTSTRASTWSSPATRTSPTPAPSPTPPGNPRQVTSAHVLRPARHRDQPAARPPDQGRHPLRR